MNIYRRGNIWWVSFYLDNERHRRSLKTQDYETALVRADEFSNYVPCYLEHADAVPTSYVTKLYHAAKCRAKRRGDKFTLTKNELMDLFERSGGLCEVTKIPFSFKKDSKFSKRPFAPSVDRISPRGIYEKSNCRIVCLAANIAMNEWGQSVFEQVAIGFVRNSRREEVSQ